MFLVQKEAVDVFFPEFWAFYGRPLKSAENPKSAENLPKRGGFRPEKGFSGQKGGFSARKGGVSGPKTPPENPIRKPHFRRKPLAVPECLVISP